MVHRRGVDVADEVRIVSTAETRARGYAGRTGVCHGFTAPSYSGVEVIGEVQNDRALNVHFDDSDGDAWFSPDLVEFVSYVEGTVIGIGDKTFRRNADGSWSPEED
jgi:hypothetical protein